MIKIFSPWQLMKTTNWQKMKKKTQTVSDEHFIDIHVVLKRKQKLYFNLSTGYSHVTQSVLSPWTLLLLLKVHRGPASGGGSHVARLNFKTSCVGVYKCLSLIVGFTVTVAIWPREVVSCRDFILRTIATFWALSLVGIYHGRASS